MDYLEMTQTDFNRMVRNYVKALAVLSVFAQAEDNKEAMRNVAIDCDCMSDTYEATH